MRLALTLFFAVFLSLTGAATQAEQPDWDKIMAEAAWDWHPGDLIFRNGLNDLDERVRDAEGGKWASVGILRMSSGGPRVVYADQRHGVTEVMLYEFIDGLSDKDYAVYRIKALDANVPGQQMRQGPLAKFALDIAYEAAYDDRMMFGNGRYYNAELPYMAAMSAGIVLADPIPLNDLGARNAALRNILLKNWRQNPYCVVAQSKSGCWRQIRGISVVTPKTLIKSRFVTRVFPK